MSCVLRTSHPTSSHGGVIILFRVKVFVNKGDMYVTAKRYRSVGRQTERAREERSRTTQPSPVCEHWWSDANAKRARQRWKKHQGLTNIDH